MKPKKKVLYIDDEPINLFVLEKILGKAYTVITCQTVDEGLDHLAKDPEINDVISDMSMPVMSGVEFIRKAQATYPQKKYFILTGYSVNEDIQEALETELIEGYFIKPANFNELNEALQKSA